MSKRGQVTVFIIIGIILLFLFAGGVYLFKTMTTDTLTAAGEPVREEVPLEFAPIQSFTENCLDSIAKRGLLILGQQGGYIYPDLLGDFSVTKPTESVGINLEPVKVPYWHYNVEPNKATTIAFASWKPELYYEDDPELSVEAQLKRYVNENVGNCLEDYTAFEGQGFEIVKGEQQEVSVSIVEETVNFLLEKELDVKKGTAETEMTRFFVKVPLRLKHFYESAQRITEAEQYFGFLESQGMNLIAVFSDTEVDKLPPTSAVTFELIPIVSWNELAVKDKVMRLLVSYVPMLRYLGSDNFYDYVYPDSELSGLYQATQDQMVLNLRGAEDLEVSFDYFNWPIFFETNSANGVIKPMHIFVKKWVLTMGQQNYDTNYDISYPVMVTLRDEAGLDGEEYNFVFGLESNIRNNVFVEDGEEREVFPMTAAKLACDQEHWDAGDLKTVVVDSFTGEPVDLVRIGFTIPDQEDCEIGLTDGEGELDSKYPAVYGGVVNFIRADYLTNFYPIDTYSYVEKPGIIGYAAAGQTGKVIEMHKYHPINISIKKKSLRKCLVPLLCKYTGSLSAIGLMLGMMVPDKDISCEKGDRQCFFGSEPTEGTVALFLGEPTVVLEANGSLSKYNEYYFTNAVEDLSEKEVATLILTRVADLNSEVVGEEFSVSVDLTGEEVYQAELVPGIYEVSGNLRLNEEMVIPGEARSVSYDILTWESEETFSFNETRVEKMVEGMISWDNSKTYLRITPEELYPAEEMEFYLLAQDLKKVPLKVEAKSQECTSLTCLPGGKCTGKACKDKEIEINGRVMEDLQLLSEMTEISQRSEIRKALEPRFK